MVAAAKRCGASLDDLVNVPGAKGASDPCWNPLWCNSSDVDSWTAQAEHVFRLVRTGWNTLHDLSVAADDRRHLDNLRTSVEAYEADFENLPFDYLPELWPGTAAEHVGALVANTQMGACQLEKINKALVDMGAGAIDPGGIPPVGRIPIWLIVGGAVAAAGAVAYVYSAPARAALRRL